MKNFKKIGLLALISISSLSIYSQEKIKKGEVKVITINEKGKSSTETYSLKDKEKIQKLLKQQGVEFNFEDDGGVKVSVTGEGEMDKKVIVKTVNNNGKEITTEEHVKVFQLGKGETKVEDGDVNVEVEELDNGKSKRITVTSTTHSFDDQEIIVEAGSESIEKGRTMVFVRKNSKETEKTDLPNKIEDTFNEDLSVSNLNLYPNPTNGNFTMNFISDKKADYEVNILDAKGSRIFKKELKGFKGEFKEDFDFTNHDSGVYYFKFFSKDKQLTKKVLVQ